MALQFVSGSSDGIIRLWDIESGDDDRASISGHTARLTVFSVSADGKLMVSASGGWGATQ